MRIAKNSVSWILTPFTVSVLFLFLTVISKGKLQSILLFVAVILLLLTGFFLIFFRDPERDVGDGVVAVADGKIRGIQEIEDSEIGRCVKISTFMNVYNVHVNRMPYEGKIKSIVHHFGSYLPAFTKESDRNERIVITIDTAIGLMKIVQIAGTLARRIVPYIQEGDVLKKGERLGIIRLGSRVDLYLPLNAINRVCVKKGARVKAGEDCIAEINA